LGLRIFEDEDQELRGGWGVDFPAVV
jgi:hypothetical protein